jgi:hypothetical protein
MWNGQIPCHPVESIGVVFVEVPKAGCTSVKWVLSPFKGGPPREGTDVHQWFGYTHADSVGQLHEWLDTRWRGFFRFTVVRDPIARFRSFYYGLQPWERGAYGDINRYVLEEFDRDPWRWDIHAVPQTMLIGEELWRFDFVGRTEDMEAVRRELSLVVGQEIEMPHLNRSPAGPRPNERAMWRLREVYRADFEALGYGEDEIVRGSEDAVWPVVL